MEHETNLPRWNQIDDKASALQFVLARSVTTKQPSAWFRTVLGRFAALAMTLDDCEISS